MAWALMAAPAGVTCDEALLPLCCSMHANLTAVTLASQESSLAARIITSLDSEMILGETCPGHEKARRCGQSSQLFPVGWLSSWVETSPP